MHDYHDAPMIYPPFLINTFLLKRRATKTKKTWEDEVFSTFSQFSPEGTHSDSPGGFSLHLHENHAWTLTTMMVMPGHDNHDYHDSHDNFPFSQLWPGTSGPGGKHKWFRRVGSGIDIDMMDTDICLIFMLQCFFRTFGNPTDPNCAQQNHNPLIQLS